MSSNEVKKPTCNQVQVFPWRANSLAIEGTRALGATPHLARPTRTDIVLVPVWFVGSRKLWLPWLSVLVWAAALFSISAVPGSSIPTSPFSSADKVVHLLLYGPLGFLVARATGLSVRGRARDALLITVAVVLAYGVSDEFHQRFVPRRSSDVRDVVADAIGGTLGGAIALFVPRMRRRAPARSRATKD